MTASRSDYAALLLRNDPILDVRSPREFERGAIPNSRNIPILTDDERHDVGLTYKQDGKAAAIARGHELVESDTKADRVSAWLKYIHAANPTALTCWRGGKRSQIAQQWLAEAGCDIPRLDGGFKALRQTSLDVIAQSSKRDWLVVAGSTGVGKTRFLRNYQPSIDLEAIANHRGSAFGSMATPQPTPVTFEIATAQALLQIADFKCCLIEDESRTIGRLAVPNALYKATQNAPLVVLEAPLSERIRFTYEEYVIGAIPTQLIEAVDRIQKRLGRERHRIVRGKLVEALRQSNAELHQEWIGCLFDWYYDPMYEFQLSRKQERIVFKGNAAELREHLATAYQLPCNA